MLCPIRRWARIFQQPNGLCTYLLDGGATRGLLPGYYHVRFEDHAFELDAGLLKFLENCLQHPFTHLIALIGIMAAVHQHLRFDDRDDILLHAYGRVTGQSMRVGR
jgi:hypothetical protein